MSKVELRQRARARLFIVTALTLLVSAAAVHAGKRDQIGPTRPKPSWIELLRRWKHRPIAQPPPSETPPSEPPPSEPPPSEPPPPAPPPVWRPFSAESPWNTPIPANAPVDPNSAALVEDLKHSSPFGAYLDINIDRYSIPLFFANASTPMVSVTAAVGGFGWGAGDFNATMAMPMPPGAAPDPESDHHIAVVDRELDMEWGCWDFDGQNHAGLCAVADLSGDGVRPQHDVAEPWSEAHGARACGFPLVAGLIRPEEIAAGQIDHALVIAYPHIRTGFYVYPASTAQVTQVEAVPTRGIPCGGRVQLDPAINVDAMTASPEAKVILRALQKYGAYVGDYSGAINIYADGSPDAQQEWSDVLNSDELRDVLDLSNLRVLEIGPMIDNGNG